MEQKKLSALAVLNRYFRNPGQSAKGFVAELKDLSDEDKIELARLAAADLGIPAGELSF